MPRTALFVRKFDDWEGDVRLYILSEPTKAPDGRWFRKVIVSSSDTLGLSSVIIYAANEDGTIATMDALHIVDNNSSHHKALQEFGYEMEVG